MPRSWKRQRREKYPRLEKQIEAIMDHFEKLRQSGEKLSPGLALMLDEIQTVKAEVKKPKLR